jgi:hypothetical protein
MRDILFSKSLRIGKASYLFNVLRAKRGKQKYIEVTEQRFNGRHRLKNSILVFPHQVVEFIKIFEEASALAT